MYNNKDNKKQSLYLDSRNIQSGTLSNAIFEVNPHIVGGVKCYYVNKIYMDSLPNINTNNNTSQILFGGILYNINIPVGYYSNTSIITPLENAINTIPGLTVSIIFNSVSNQYTFTFSNPVTLPFNSASQQFLFKTLLLQGFNSTAATTFTGSPLPLVNGIPTIYYSRTVKICSDTLAAYNMNQINASSLTGLFSTYNSPAYPSNCIETIFIKNPFNIIEYEPYNEEKFAFSKSQYTNLIDIRLFNDRNQPYYPDNIGTYRIELVLIY
jgi:hypothetical protein